MGSRKKYVDYLDLLARRAEEERPEQEQDSVMPEPRGEQAVDYLAASRAWKGVCRVPETIGEGGASA